MSDQSFGGVTGNEAAAQISRSMRAIGEAVTTGYVRAEWVPRLELLWDGPLDAVWVLTESRAGLARRKCLSAILLLLQCGVPQRQVELALDAVEDALRHATQNSPTCATEEQWVLAAEWVATFMAYTGITDPGTIRMSTRLVALAQKML